LLATDDINYLKKLALLNIGCKMGKTPHPPCPPDVGGAGGATPCPQEKLFAANPN